MELGIGLMELGIGLRNNNARRTVLARVSGLVNLFSSVEYLFLLPQSSLIYSRKEHLLIGLPSIRKYETYKERPSSCVTVFKITV